MARSHRRVKHVEAQNLLNEQVGAMALASSLVKEPVARTWALTRSRACSTSGPSVLATMYSTM